MKQPNACCSDVDFRKGLGALWLLCALLLGGCGTVAGVLIAPVVVGVVPGLVTAAADAAVKFEPPGEPSPQDSAVPGMIDGLPIDYPITTVYRALVRVAETNGLKIVAIDDAAYKLRVAYPFSLTQNNWGGEIVVTCVVDGYGTRVLFEDDGHDAPWRVKKIEARLLDGTLKWLRQPGLGS